MDIKDCLRGGYLVKEIPSKDLIEKELRESKYDLKRVKRAFGDKDFKGAITNSYYSMFHSAKAVCFSLGYREKKHFALVVILTELNKRGKLESRFINDFKAAISAREDADYHYFYSKERAEEILKIAEGFNKRMKDILERI